MKREECYSSWTKHKYDQSWLCQIRYIVYPWTFYEFIPADPDKEQLYKGIWGHGTLRSATGNILLLKQPILLGKAQILHGFEVSFKQMFDSDGKRIVQMGRTRKLLRL